MKSPGDAPTTQPAVVTTGLWRLFLDSHAAGGHESFSARSLTNEEPIRRHETTLHVLVTPTLTAQQIDGHLYRGSGVSILSMILARAAFGIAGFALAAALLVVLGLIDTFNGLLSALLVDAAVGGTRAWLVLGVTFLIGAIALSFAPRLLSPSQDGIAAYLIRTWVDNEGRAVQRIRLRLRRAHRRGLKTVVIWNPGAGPEQGRKNVATALSGSPLSIVFRVFEDEVDEFAAYLRVRGFEVASVTEGPSGGGRPEPEEPSRTRDAPADGDLFSRARTVLGAGAEEALVGLMACSTSRAKARWQDSLAGVTELARGVASIELASLATARTDAGVADASSGGRLWFERFVRDLGLFIRWRPGALVFAPGQPWQTLHREHRHRLDRWKSVRSIPSPELTDSLMDPVSLLCLLVSLGDEDRYSEEFGHILERCISRSHSVDFLSFAHFFVGEFPPGKPTGADHALLRGMAIDRLRDLVRLMSSAGYPAIAFPIQQWVSSMGDSADVLELARLSERRFDRAGAESLHDQIAPRVSMLFDRLVTGGAVSRADTDLVIDFHLHRAWLPVIFGPRDASEYTKTTEAALTRLDSLREAEAVRLSTVQLHRLETRWGHFFELTDRFDESVARHRAAAGIPGIRLGQYNGSLINLGLALRRKATAAYQHRTQPVAEICANLSEAATSATEGFRSKMAIGDWDEASIGGHNAALSEILSAQWSEDLSDRERRTKLVAAVDIVEACLRGLESVAGNRKRGLLEIEGRMAGQALALLGSGRTYDSPGWLSRLPLSRACFTDTDVIEAYRLRAALSTDKAGLTYVPIVESVLAESRRTLDPAPV